ncbi:hypothetical protein AB205_0155880, partial [Aquarana catesbeiana]
MARKIRMKERERRERERDEWERHYTRSRSPSPRHRRGSVCLRTQIHGPAVFTSNRECPADIAAVRHAHQVGSTALQKGDHL